MSYLLFSISANFKFHKNIFAFVFIYGAHINIKIKQLMKKENLGAANCNPLNIRYVVTNHWLGLDEECPQRNGFCHFTDINYGLRAAYLILKRYVTKYGLNTPEKIINKWAPPSENDTSGYIRAVCAMSGLKRNSILSTDCRKLLLLLSAMARQESGYHVSPTQLEKIKEIFHL